MKSIEKKHFLIAIGLVFIAAFARFMPHFWNFTPIAAIALFSGVYFKNKIWAFALPILCLFGGDMILQAQYWAGNAAYPAFFPGTWAVYASILLIVALGFLFHNKVTPLRVLGGALAGSILFFIITNFAAWATDYQTYPVKTVGTLVEAYIAGIPFYRGTLIGDLFYSGLLFGSFELIKSRITMPVLAKK